MYTSTFLLRLITAIILLIHSIPGMFNGGIRDFGLLYLDPAGFAPFGLFLAWCIKLSHVAAAICLVTNRWIKPAAIITITILIAGIVMVHFREGWFVVGGGRNGMEYNVLLIAVLTSILLQRPASTFT
jgi:putative oxidoreductase